MQEQVTTPSFTPNPIYAAISAPDAPAFLLSTEEAALALGLKKNTLEIWRLRGTPKLKFVKIGELVRYRSQDILAYIESQLRTSTSDTGVAK